MGFIVGLSGIDGSGKTTIAQRVVEVLKSQGYQATYHHELNLVFFGPVFRFVRRILGKKAEAAKEQVILGTWKGKSLYSHLYYVIVCLDTYIAYMIFKLRRGITICDRWTYDIPPTFSYRQYRNWIIEKLLLCTPRPDVMILLKVPSDVACLRKKDDEALEHTKYDVQYYETLSQKIEQIARELKYDTIVDSSRNVDIVFNDVILSIANKMEVKGCY